ncbi:hypothetical protein CONPUDRAFT_155686 [Coniophora puteana RWD-64-598 SS2]|uniref:Nephrocystin 3-like N-terminal domain-containing protein n=1 Tax=Coniophora puteana (strain RWD-64-598) TaxID=741705 RepID=A0A5M3MKD4_CONPW|nr:uncharacterized protein CONPUDRAFT_155686 [Coniophora puteana RWD-64-598 SS2]EIW79001.1 hypothetical protein CONPUDRAFT_155686 [Coniophora puteana RWD-64-598 SS2]
MAEIAVRSREDHEIWLMLSREIAHGAAHDSAERHPISSCLSGTRFRVLDTLEASLSQVDRKVVWLFGRAGAGKSSVAYSLAERLREQDKLAASFFFSQKHLSRSNTDRVFLTIAYQLGLRHHRAKACVIEAIRRDPTLLRPETSRREQCERLVVEPLKSLRNVWGGGDKVMIFDAAEEAEAPAGKGGQIRESVLLLTELIRNTSPHPLPISGILITSRPFPRLENILKEPGITDLFIRHSLEDFDAVRDVTLYLQYYLCEVRNNDDRLYRYPCPWPIDGDLSMMAKLMKGHFIVAATVQRLVQVADDPVHRLDTITRFYRGDVRLGRARGDIDSIYHFVLSNCDESIRRPAVECLADVMSLAEPLTPMLLWELFGYDARDRISHLAAVVNIPHSRSSLDPIQIYHVSLRDYVSDQRRSGGFYVDASESHQRLAFMCLTVMQRQLEDSYGGGEPSHRHSNFPNLADRHNKRIIGCLQYACQYWAHHLERAKDDEGLHVLVLDFLENRRSSFVEFLSLLVNRDMVFTVLSGARRVVATWSTSEEHSRALRLLDSTLQLVTPANVRRSAVDIYPDGALSKNRTRRPSMTSPTSYSGTSGVPMHTVRWESKVVTPEGKADTNDDSSATFVSLWALVTMLFVMSYLLI